MLSSHNNSNLKNNNSHVLLITMITCHNKRNSPLDPQNQYVWRTRRVCYKRVRCYGTGGAVRGAAPYSGGAHILPVR